MLVTPINTKSAFVGASIYCESVYPITVGNRIIIPRGSSVKGTITQVVRPGHVKGRAQIGLRFDELILPNGTTVQLRAVLSGFGSPSGEKFKPDEGRIEGESTKGQDIGKIATTTVEGAGMGTLIGGLSNGHAGEGAGIGAGAGAVGGLIWVLASRGKDAVLPHGTSLELKLTQPLNFSRWEVQPRSPYDEGPTIPRREYGPRH
jgi:type IV secretion system protein VirB10